MLCLRKQKKRRYSPPSSGSRKKYVKTSLSKNHDTEEKKTCVYECNECGLMIPIDVDKKKFGSGIWIHNERVHFIDYSPRCVKTNNGNVHIVDYSYKKTQ